MVLSDLEGQQAYWTSVITRAEAANPDWKILRSADVAAVDGGEAARVATSLALDVWSQTLLALEQSGSETTGEPYSLEVLLASLVSVLRSPV